MASHSDAVEFGKRIASAFTEKNVSFMAAALAYHAFISLAPMLLLLFLLFTTVGVGVENSVVRTAVAWLPGPIAEVVTELLQGGTDGTGASLVGLLVLLWGTLKIFRGLDTAFSEIYESVDTDSLLATLRDALVVLFALAVALVAMVGSSVVLGGLAGRLPYTEWLTPLALLVGLVVAFFPIYYVFPDVDVGFVDVVPGVVVAAVGWGALQGLFQLYLRVADPSAGDFFGGVLVVVTYLYFSALVLLLGAVVNAVGGRHVTGGVARPPADFETERSTTIEPAALVAYLADLRTELLSDRGTATRTEMVGPRPRPDGDVELLERSRTEGDENEWLVTLRWTYSEEEPAASRGQTGGDEAAGQTDTAGCNELT